jgi:hypothetical protein
MNNVDTMTVGLANLFRHELDHCRDWPSGRLLTWIRWFVVKQRYLVSVRDGRLAGAALLRYVDDEAGCRSDYCDTGGRICYVDATVATERGVMKELFTEMFEKFGKDCDLIAWVRPKHDSKIVCVDMERARRHLIKE